ncbi:hypothetical protein [Methylobacterium ajmalii]|uniref:hypothetical protein n=1 Tax=Methylobacterium ajmalii TaxID=2738439 RepID=UPI002F35CA0D
MTAINHCSVVVKASTPDARASVVSDFAKAVMANAEAIRANAVALTQLARGLEHMPAPVTAGIMVQSAPTPAGPRLDISDCNLRCEQDEDL